MGQTVHTHIIADLGRYNIDENMEKWDRFDHHGPISTWEYTPAKGEDKL